MSLCLLAKDLGATRNRFAELFFVRSKNSLRRGSAKARDATKRFSSVSKSKKKSEAGVPVSTVNVAEESAPADEEAPEPAPATSPEPSGEAGPSQAAPSQPTMAKTVSFDAPPPDAYLAAKATRAAARSEGNTVVATETSSGRKHQVLITTNAHRRVGLSKYVPCKLSLIGPPGWTGGWAAVQYEDENGQGGVIVEPKLISNSEVRGVKTVDKSYELILDTPNKLTLRMSSRREYDLWRTLLARSDPNTDYSSADGGYSSTEERV